MPSQQFDAARQFVEFGLREQAAGRRESASGPHGTPEATAPFRGLLLKAISEHNIRSILDLGCGDWNWMRLVPLPADVTYEGWDAHEGMIRRLNENYGSERVSFHAKDIGTEEYPQVDLIVCRSVLFHIDQAISRGMVERMRKSASFLLANSFNDVPRNTNIKQYLKIDGWGFYPINLSIAPFELAPFLMEAVEEPTNAKQQRYVCLYGFS